MKTSIVYQLQGTLTFLYLRLGITTETDSAVNPLYLPKQSGIFGSDKPGIKSLIEIYPQSEVDDLLELLLSVGSSRKNVVVHQYDMRAPLNGYLFNIHIRTDCAFFLRDNTPKTVVRASLRQPCSLARWERWNSQAATFLSRMVASFLYHIPYLPFLAVRRNTAYSPHLAKS